MSLAEKLFGSFSDRELKKINPLTKQVLALEGKYQAMSDAELQAQTPALKQKLADGKTLDDILPDAFAVCREAAWRVLGMKHFPVQVTGGIALHRGDIAEMQTGEGKTLVATLPAYLNALTGEGALLASLNAKRTGKMTDIVATIQGEQDRIIRADLNQAVVVQGGPGTGKTAVALHRAAYLLYTHRRALQRSGVLVVGPSSTFLHYIDQVLPSLGETGVVSRTIADLIPGIIATAHDDPYAAKLKGERRMAKAIANAVAARERVPSHLPVIRINGFNVPMVRADIEQAIADAKRTRQPHNKARETFVRDMLSAMRNRYVERLDYEPEQAELNDVMQQLRMNDDLRKTLNLADDRQPPQPCRCPANGWSTSCSRNRSNCAVSPPGSKSVTSRR